MAPPDAKNGLGQALRILGGEGGRAAPSIAMPRAKTELSALLAGDPAICVRRPAPIASAQDPIARVAAAPAFATADADLARLVEAWPSLPRSIRAAITAMVREAAADAPS
jgi:hypothetical protein